ncbi:MAG: selenocysteine synthase [Gemmatimonadetes bacterium]|nr:selenocysteine synthase [Gemmatimonadota bacterium]
MVNRRQFTALGLASVAGAALPFEAAGAPLAAPAPEPDYYAKLGVAKIINAAGTYTYLTASTMPREVQDAVAFAARHPVRLSELQRGAGDYLAKRLQCEAAMVTCGAASALSIATAACITLNRRGAAEDVPARVRNFPHEVIVQKAHHAALSHMHALEMAGATLVDVETAADFEKAFTPMTVMAFYFNAADEGQIGREEWIRVARSHGVPTFNDAAADVPPISNLWTYTKMGFDLVAFSGGKGMRGPQNAGLLLGRKDLIDAGHANNVPNDRAIGRGMKVAKEQIVGMVAAVDWFLAQNEDALRMEWQAQATRIATRLSRIPTVTYDITVPPVANNVPHLRIRYDRAKVNIAPLDVAKALREGTPSIELNPATGRTSGAAGLSSDENTIVVGVWMLEPGEDLVVAKRLDEVLTKAIV